MIKLKKKIIEENRTSPDQNFLLTGETSVGKELFAAAIHETSQREDKYLRINFAAISKDTIASDLFGHVKGAFTGADSNKEGLFAAANKGTILLDEIGEIPIEQQPYLLRVIRESEILPVGGTKTKKIDVKMIFATNRDLKKEVKNGTFREDLYYRINGNPIDIPPLRKRKDDIPLLVRHFVKNSGIINDIDSVKNLPDIDEQVFSILKQHDWPGNIQELNDVVKKIVKLWIGSNKEKIGTEHIPESFINELGSQISQIQKETPLEEAYRFLEAIKRNKGIIAVAARELKVNTKKIDRRLKLLPPEVQTELSDFRKSQKSK